MRNKRVTKITAALNSMNKNDVYSLMLFTLYKMKDIPDYLTLTELAYLLDGDTLSRFLSYYGGMTIKIPTVRDLKLVLQALSLYQYVNVDKGDFDTGLKAVTTADFNPDEIKLIYSKIVEVIENYEFDTKQESD